MIVPLDTTVSCFSCRRLNSSTFLIIENDRYGEYPFIYAKIYESPPLLVLSDSGCGGLPGVSTGTFRADTLRNFLETVPILQNGGKALNPPLEDGTPSLEYLIICTHCHYDHILGIPSFQHASPTILASCHERSFIENDLPKHSLCSFLGVLTPQYVVSYWAKDEESIVYDSLPLGIVILHTPGHTPDELAWYDKDERHLYVGDTLYNRMAENNAYTQAIEIPLEGNIHEYMLSLKKMIAFVEQENNASDKTAVKLGSGHTTSSVNAREILVTVQQYFQDLIAGKIPVKQTTVKRGEIFDLWQEEGEPMLSVQAPRRLIEDVRRKWNV